jgi:uncharacterized protein (DUF58 family)
LTTTRILASGDRRLGQTGRAAAFLLSRALPRLVTEARRLSANVVAGIHGRRRAGTGETFWQFRSFVPGEPVARIDWRRSARDDRITIRDREWEAAQTIWLWIDRSPSMAFASDLAVVSKLERALVVGLAAADMLVRGGERVGLIGLTPPVASRAVIDRLAEALLLDREPEAELPPPVPLPASSEAILISDFIRPLDDIRSQCRRLSERRARGHMVCIVDPTEELFPFDGHNEFIGTEPGPSLRVGDSAAFATAYRRRIAAHRDGLRAIANELGWSFTLHRTDRPAAGLLLTLRLMLEVGQAPSRSAGG